MAKLGLLVLLLPLIFFVDGQTAKFKCPSYTPSNNPCNCRDINGTYSQIECVGPKVTQEVISKFFVDLRRLNPPSKDGWLKVPYDFYLIQSPLALFDLTPLFKTEFKKLKIGVNLNLTSVSGPSSPTKDQLGSIRVQEINIFNNDGPNQKRKDDAGFQNLFKFFDPKSVRYVNIADNNLERSQQTQNEIGAEYFKDLFSLTQLETLSLNNYFRCGHLAGGQFQKLTKLKQLYFERSTVRSIAADAFKFDDPPAGSLTGTDEDKFRIDLDANWLTNDKIAVGAFDKFKRPTSISLDKNSLTTLEREKFEPFLLGNGKNFITVNRNNFTCDGGMKWLKDRKQEVEKRVIGVLCTNDPGKTIFNTKKV